MKAKFLIVLLIVGSISIATTHNAGAQKSPSDEQAIAMIKKFYTAYMAEILKSTNPIDLTKLEAIPKKYCTASLLNEINARFKRGYVNSDPFIFAQDVDDLMIKTLMVETDFKKVNSYTVSSRYPATPGTTEKKIIHVMVVKQGENFKIASIK